MLLFFFKCQAGNHDLFVLSTNECCHQEIAGRDGGGMKEMEDEQGLSVPHTQTSTRQECLRKTDFKRYLLLGRKVMTNLDSILKSRDITLPTKVHLVKAMVFPVVMYGCES